MNRKVVISKTAEKKSEQLFSFLIKKWSLQVKLGFIEKLDTSVQIIRNQPESFPESKIKKGLRKYVITKQTTLFYRFDSKNIFVVAIFDTR
ncbi:type II toxin-antitoxin system RelE/ParE family toxin [Flavivirga algicola]|uniref:Type II toxin-antitoxin system RelE/ParE family toxin n=1 Tax=Flavivirga algicola TaxID=2729136 RepID=A0ABX1RVI4_9FLAO|nr:type II toxin-antitoxin system RelE/ParE family toxin [Flavivirga algicola]NMH86703.1 type II toxin-antitoxin system RelE/ParE family toxin [Flavivirga algicola]